MLNFNFKPFPRLETDRLLLRRITKEDQSTLFLLKSDVQVLRYSDSAPATEMNEVLSLLNKMDQSIDANNGISWGIALKENNELIGTAGFWRTTPEHHRAEIGYNLLPEFWKKGIMTEALVRIFKYGFNEMNLHSVEANVNPGNLPSIKLLEKLGFEKEAYFKENYYFDGKFVDSVIYSLLVHKFTP